MTKLASEELFNQVKALETTDISTLLLTRMAVALYSAIKNYDTEIKTHAKLLEFLSQKNRRAYSTKDEQVRALEILRYSILILANCDTVKSKSLHLSSINKLNLSSDEVAYVKIIARNASLQDSDLIVADVLPDADVRNLTKSTADEETTVGRRKESDISKTRVVMVKKPVSNTPKSLFIHWQEFASTPLGLLFTVGTPILGVAAFIALAQFHMDFIGGMVLAGAVFGDIALGLMASKLQKHGFFKCCGVDSDDSLSNKSNLHMR